MTIKNRGGVFGRNPTFNDVNVDGTLSIAGAAVPAPADTLTTSDIGSTVQAYDADTAKLDVAQTFTQDQIFNTQIGVGIDPSNFNQIQDSGQSYAFGKGTGTPSLTMYSANNASGRIAFADGLTGNEQYRGWLEYDHSVDAMAMRTAATERFKITSTGDCEVKTGNLVISTSGNGIDFSATAGTGTSELFDDYEEGTWTPVAASANGDASVTTSVSSANYTKIGNVVYFNCYISMNVTSVGTGAARITGLPFTNNGGYTAFTSVHETFAGSTGQGWIRPSETTLEFLDANSTSQKNISGTGTKYAMLAGSYLTNS